MTNKNNQQVLIGGAIIFREKKGKKQYLIIKSKEDGIWELPKVTVRRGESSVRAVIRMTGEQIGISGRVLEEAGRYSNSLNLNGKSITQKHYYYLEMQRSEGGETIGFNDSVWLEYSQCLKKIQDKKEKDIFQKTKDILKEWEKTKKDKIDQEEEELLQEEISAGL